MSAQRNATITARLCLGWQSPMGDVSALTTTTAAEMPIRLPSQRPIDQRWDRSRGLVFSHPRRPVRSDLTWKPGGGILFSRSSSSRRTYASRPPPGRRPTGIREQNHFMETSEDSGGGSIDRNAIVKATASRDQALQERDLARTGEQRAKEQLSRLQADWQEYTDRTKGVINQLESQNTTLDKERRVARNERNVARRQGLETQHKLDEAEAEVRALKDYQAAVDKELAELHIGAELERREKERKVEHERAMEDIHNQRKAILPAQEDIKRGRRALEARQEQLRINEQKMMEDLDDARRTFESDKTSLANKYAVDLSASRDELRKEYEQSEVVWGLRERQRRIEDSDSARIQAEYTAMVVRERDLRKQVEDSKTQFNTQLLLKSSQLEDDMARRLAAATLAVEQRRTLRAEQRSDYHDYRALFRPPLQRDLQIAFSQMQQLLSDRLLQWRPSPHYLSAMKNANPWFPLSYPRLVSRLENFMKSRRHQIHQDISSASNLADQLATSLQAFLSSAHTSRESTRFHRLSQGPSNFWKTSLLNSLLEAQPLIKEARRRKLAAAQLQRRIDQAEERGSVSQSNDLERMRHDRALAGQLTNLHFFSLDTAKAYALKAMQEDEYPKQVSFRMLHEQTEKFDMALMHSQRGDLSRMEYLELKNELALTGKAIMKFEGDVQKRALLKERLRFADTLEEKQAFKEWSDEEYNNAMEKTRKRIEPRGASRSSRQPALERMPLSRRLPQGVKPTLRKQASALPVAQPPRIGPSRSKGRKESRTRRPSHQWPEVDKSSEPTVVSDESSKHSSLNLKPTVATQARHALGLSHPPRFHNTFPQLGICFELTNYNTLMQQMLSSSSSATHHERPDDEDVDSASASAGSTFALSDTDSIYSSEASTRSNLETQDRNASSESILSSPETKHENTSPKSDTIPDVPLTYQIPTQAYRDAARASRNTDAAFWTYTLYKNADGKKPDLHYCVKFDQAEECAQRFLNESVLGFDLEWEVGSNAKSSIKDSVSLIQIASGDRIGLFQIALFKGDTIEQLMPPSLRTILESETIVKAGVNISGDATRMERCLDVKMKGLMELSHLYKVVTLSESEPQKVNRGLVRLAEQVEKILLLPLKKGTVRTSAWSKRLNIAQTEYAGTDAYAGFRIYHALEAKRKMMDPKPPRPEFYELRAPLVLGDGTVIRPYVKKTSSKKAEAQEDDESDVSSEEFFDAVETLDPYELDIAAAAADSPFMGVDVAYPTLPTLEADVSRLRITDTAPSIPSDEDPAPVDSITDELDTLRVALPTKRFARNPPPDTPEFALATSWTDTWLLSQPISRVSKAGPTKLRVYHLWHVQNLEVSRVAVLASQPPLMQATVANYIMAVLTQERLPYDKHRVSDVLGHLPRGVVEKFEGFLPK